jgi:rRNA maturation endonuclease Nob1
LVLSDIKKKIKMPLLHYQEVLENRRIYTPSNDTLNCCMAKKCERCQTPALSDDSEYCNRCGSFVIEEPKLHVPICSRCNSPAPNAEVLFCNRCGAQYPAAEPAPTCPRCGNIIPDAESEFCNRCGAPVRTEPEVPLCSRCGNPAPDADALFCNRCGTAYKKEPVNIIPLCPQCGHTLPDDQSPFCNRCGASVSTGPVDKKPVCGNCGAVKTDEDTLFCNRCGTQFNHQVSRQKTVPIPGKKPALPASVKISRKKQVPAIGTSEELWDPVQEEVIAPGYFSYPAGQPAASSQKKYTHLPLVAEELSGGKIRDESIVMPANGKKYAHLPLIADEFKEKQSPRIEIESPYYPGPPNEKKSGKGKKGFFDLLKK